MGTTRLQIYQDALLLCGERFLASLTENNEARRLLDNVWNSQGVQYCLEQGQWQFAMRAIRLDYDPDIQTQWGYTYAFNKPTDWVLTSALCSDERFTMPLTRYRDEVDNWYADITPIYLQYVSNDADYGLNLGRWPSTFADYVSSYFAQQICTKLTRDKQVLRALLGPQLNGKDGLVDQNLLIARSRAAMTQGTRFPAAGSWVRSRRGLASGRGPLGDGGTSGSLNG